MQKPYRTTEGETVPKKMKGRGYVTPLCGSFVLSFQLLAVLFAGENQLPIQEEGKAAMCRMCVSLSRVSSGAQEKLRFMALPSENSGVHKLASAALPSPSLPLTLSSLLSGKFIMLICSKMLAPYSRQVMTMLFKTKVLERHTCATLKLTQLPISSLSLPPFFPSLLTSIL